MLSALLKGQRIEIELASLFVDPLVDEIVRHFSGIEEQLFSQICDIANTVTRSSTTPARRVLSIFRIAEFVDQYLSLGPTASIGAIARWNAVEGGATHEDRIGALMVLVISGRALLRSAILSCISCLDQRPIDADVDKALSATEIVPWVDRIATRDIALGSHHLPQGRRVRLDLRFSANASENRFLPFGLGAHYCLGAALTREVCHAVLSTMQDCIELHSARTVLSPPSPIGGPIELWCIASAR
jgi:hypothetical protein